jgi:hypothetical protein
MKDFKLENEPKITPGFTIPEGYFNSFSEKVLTQLPKEESKVITIPNTKMKWYFAVAAILILMLAIPIYTNLSTQQDEIDAVTLENYIAYHAAISEDEIVDLLNQEDLERMKIELNIDDVYIEDILKSNTNLEEYLIN